MKKRMLCWLLALVMVFSLMPAFGMNAAAADTAVSVSGSLTDTRITLSATTSNTGNNAYSWSASGNTITGYAAGTGNQYTGTDTTTVITITNNSHGKAKISFHYVMTPTAENNSHYYGHMNINGGSDIGGGSSSAVKEDDFISDELEDGQSVTVSLFAYKGAGYGRSVDVTLSSVTLTPVGGTNPDDPPLNPDDIVDGNFVYSPAQTGLHVGDDIDLSQTYYVKVDGQWKEVSISKDTYYSEKTGDTYNHYVQKTEKSDGFYGDADPITGWTPITGDGMYYMKDHNTFLQVQSVTGKLTHYAYSNKLIASKSDNEADGLVTGPSESIGGWTTGDTTAIVVERDGTQHQVLYANKGSTFHYNMFVYYVDSNGDVVYLTQGANESDGDSKYYNTYPTDRKSDTPAQGVGKYYYTYNNTLGSYGGKGYYTGTYYKPGNHDGKIALYFVDGGETKWLSTSGVQTQESARTTAIHDQQVVYTGPLYQLQTLQRATYFSYEGGTPVESRLAGDELTSLTLYTRRMSGEAEITDTDPDNGTGANQMGTLVDTTNNFKGNLFIQKKLYRAEDGTYNIKLESWATGDMNQSGGGEPTDIVLVVDLSNSMWQSDTKDLTDTDGSAMYRSTAVIRAISSFIDTLHEADPNGENYRLSIVSFSGEPDKDGYGGWVFLFDGPNHYYKTTDINSHANASLKPVDNAGVTALKQSINTTEFKEPKGDNTYPANGLDLAKIVLNKRTTHTDRPATVIMFTDGVPGTGTGRGYSKYADPAIESAYDLKHNYNATIYTVGLFNFNDENLMGHSRASASEYMGTIIDPGTYSVKEYMEAVSSKYPNAQTEVIPGYATPSGEQPARRPCNLTPENTDQQYYFKVDTSHGSVGIQTLLDAFGSIASTIAETDVPVTTSSILRDVINTEDFALPKYIEGTTVKASTVPASEINSRKQIAWDYAHEAPATGLTISVDRLTNMDGGFLKSVDVKGYDYQANFSAPAAGTASAKLGNKLVVRIYGLMPKHGGEVYSNSEAGILNKPEGSSSFEMYLPVESPFDFIDTRSYVVDFNAAMKVAQNGYLASDNDKYVTDITGRTGDLKKLNGTNGFFSNIENAISYQLKEKTLINGSESFQDYSYVGTDTALVFGQYYDTTRSVDGKTVMNEFETLQRINGKEEPVKQSVEKAWQVVNMVPASSVYYDDDLAGESVVVGDGSGFNSAVTVTPAENEASSNMTFAFTGTGIDIYCTTDKSGGYAQAKLDGSTVQSMRNYSETPRYNVPTFSFRGLDYGQHSVTINILSVSHYRFDGVRVYGPVEDQEIYEGTTEQNAVYANIRAAMINSTNAYDASTADNVSIGDQVALSGVLFVDDSSKMAQVIDNSTGLPPVEGADKEHITTVYQSQFAAYTNNSPKNEIYLAPSGTEVTRWTVAEDGTQTKTTETLSGGQAITFTLNGTAEGRNIWIGLSAPNSTTAGGSVNVNGHDMAVQNAVDMYYPITDYVTFSGEGENRTASVTITNSGTTMISITNLKLADKLPQTTAAEGDNQDEGNSIQQPENLTNLSVDALNSKLFAPMTMRSIKLAANNGVDPDLAVVEPEPTAEPEPSPTAEPEVTPDPTPAPTAAPTPVPTHTPSVHSIVKQLVSSFVSSLFRSISRLFG